VSVCARAPPVPPKGARTHLGVGDVRAHTHGGSRPLSPTARSLRYLRECGHVADVVERWIPRANVRRDLFGVIDVVAVRRGEAGVLGVQATTLPNVAARLAKAKTRAELRTWLAAANRFAVFGWYRRGGRWRVKIVELRAEDLASLVIQGPPRRSRKPVQADLFG